jgi:hypothetical protein
MAMVVCLSFATDGISLLRIAEKVGMKEFAPRTHEKDVKRIYH